MSHTWLLRDAKLLTAFFIAPFELKKLIVAGPRGKL